jgi:hypothetical protein
MEYLAVVSLCPAGLSRLDSHRASCTNLPHIVMFHLKASPRSIWLFAPALKH